MISSQYNFCYNVTHCVVRGERMRLASNRVQDGECDRGTLLQWGIVIRKRTEMEKRDRQRNPEFVLSIGSLGHNEQAGRFPICEL